MDLHLPREMGASELVSTKGLGSSQQRQYGVETWAEEIVNQNHTQRHLKQIVRILCHHKWDREVCPVIAGGRSGVPVEAGYQARVHHYRLQSLENRVWGGSYVLQLLTTVLPMLESGQFSNDE